MIDRKVRWIIEGHGHLSPGQHFRESFSPYSYIILPPLDFIDYLSNDFRR